MIAAGACRENQRCILHGIALLPGSRKRAPGSVIFLPAHNMKRRSRRQEQTLVAPTSLARQVILIVTVAILSACAATTPERTSVIKTLRNIEGAASFGNVLVVSAAGDRASRHLFEQEIAAAISNEATMATPFYAVAGRQSTISRNVLDKVVRAREFDAILLVRRKGQEQQDPTPTRPTGRQFDLYIYDYDELNDLTGIDTASTVAFVAEFYDTGSAEKIWSIESLVFEAESVTSAVSQQVVVIAAELRKDRLVTR